MTKNPADYVDAPRVHTEEVHSLTRDEARRILKVVRGDRLEALYIVALHTGLRQGELLALRWEDVDIEDAHSTSDNHEGRWKATHRPHQDR